MDNHYHLLIETLLPNLSQTMRHIDGVYTQRFNKIHGRDGALLRGRFKSILIQKETYLLELVRYIHLNGVKAIQFPSARFDIHCSHPDYLNLTKPPAWLTQDLVLSFFDRPSSNPREELERFVNEGVPKDLEGTLDKKRWPAILGLKDFIESVREKFVPGMNRYSHPEIPEQRRMLKEQLPPVELILDQWSKTYGINRDIWRTLEWQNDENQEARWALMALLRLSCQMTHRKIGEFMGGLSYSAVSKFLSRNNFTSSPRFKTLQNEILQMSNVKT